MSPDDNEVDVPDLDTGKEYEFRVVPLNAAGPGEASETSVPCLTKIRKRKHIDLHNAMV